MADKTILDLNAVAGTPVPATDFFEFHRAASFNSEKYSLQSLINKIQSITTGYADIADGATSVTPIAVSASTATTLTNDNAGSDASADLPEGVTDIWDESGNAFIFDELAIGDIVRIRIDIEVTTSAANQEVEIYLAVNQSPGTPFEIPFEKSILKTAGAHQISRYNAIYIGSAGVRDNPSQFKIVTDATADVVVNGWFVDITRRSI